MGFGSPSNETPEERFQRLRNGLKGYADAGIFGRLTYTFVGTLLALGKAGGLDEDVGPELLPKKDTADKLAARFDDVYDKVCASRPDANPASVMWRTYYLLYRRRITSQILIGLLMTGIRVGQPLLLRKLVSWFWAAESAREGQGPPVSGGEGWMWACLLALLGYLGCLAHHAFFWRGMRNGLFMRLQAMAAIQRKVLRLNAVGVADVTPGKIINILSNDVRRFDDSSTHGLFLVISPIELVIVLVLIGIRMGFPAAAAGVGTSLLLIPLQGLLGRRIVKLRGKIAALSDERVRLTSEAISGVLAAKMLVWEPDLLQRILAVRKEEDACVKSQARIRGVNMGVAFAITPLASLITFAVVRATGHQLTVANVFYTIALLQLPKLFMADYFVKAVETLSELSVTMRRLGDFMAVAEPPAPYHYGVGRSGEDRPGTIDIPELDFDWEVLPWVQGGGGKKKKDDEEGKGVPSAMDGAASPHDVRVTVCDDEGASKLSIEDHHDTPAARRRHTLSDIVLHASPGELIGVIGEVGAGKSSLLEVILGELQPLGGRDCPITVSGSLAYVAQVPWVCAGTLRDNITFGKAYDKELYDRVLTACALNDDLAPLAAGDQTELGERGINLSGGQKARLTLARAAYSQASVQVLDDPLSAVDPRVAKVLFESCLGPQGIMSGSTRVLATHQAQFLGPCDTVLVLRGGRIAERGTLAELVARQVPEALSSMHMETALDDDTYDDHGNGDDDETDEVDEAIAREKEGATESVKEVLTPEGAAPLQDDSFTGSKEGVTIADEEGAGNNSKLERSKSLLTLRGDSTQSPLFIQKAVRGSSVLFNPRLWRRQRPQDLSKGTEAEDNSPMMQKEATTGSLVVTEDRSVGSVGWSVYKSLLEYMGWPVVFVILAALLGGQAIYIYGDYWIALWSSKPVETQQEGYWIWGYGIMVGSLFIISLVRAQLFFVFSLRAATALHNIMIARVLRAPLSFFHTNPAGRILNRFSKDQGAVDDQLPLVVYDAVQAAMQVLGAFVLLMVVVPVIIPIFLPLGLAFVLVYRHYVTTSREVKRYEAVTRSPIFASFSALIKGLPSIRAYGAFDRFRDEFLRDLTVNGAWYFVFVTCARWVGFRMDMLVALLMTAAPLLMMGIHDRLTARLVGLGLSQSLQLGGVMQWMTRQTAEMENHMTSVERMLAYTELEQEPPTLELGGKEPPPAAAWPSRGTVQLDQVTVVYRRGLPPVLRALSFTIPGGASCGVVGRTGSGKSSLLLALFRLIPVVDGVISIDSIDTSSIALDALRRQIAIIPQDPVLFSGTLRSNLDPWNKFDDAMLWNALRTVQLEGPLRALGGLAAPMLDGGENLSVGQRQLFCLARALLQGASILAMDEATANVDRATDGLIQEAVRSFGRGDGELSSGKKKTVIVIAHRIHTIMDCDKLLVLSAGRLVETGKPTELAKGTGVFARLVHAARGGH